mgnify:FL=1
MLRYQQYLDESLDSAVPWRWTNKDQYTYIATFRVKDATYTVLIDDVSGGWELTFKLSHLSGGKPGHDPYGVTGSGGEYAVFSTVIDIIKAFIREIQPMKIIFSAKEASRKRLYKTLLALVPRQVPGYKSRMGTDDYGAYEIVKEK